MNSFGKMFISGIAFASGALLVYGCFLLLSGQADRSPAITFPKASTTSMELSDRKITLKGNGGLIPFDGELVSFIKRHYEINPDLLVPHTGWPLPSTGAWTESDYKEEQLGSSLCHTGDVDCYVVRYVVESDQVICGWVVAIFKTDRTNFTVTPDQDAKLWFRKRTS